MTQSEKKLLDFYESMGDEGKSALLDYAEYLTARYPAPKVVPQAPLTIPRPQEETVVAAIKRLSQTYPMLERQSLLHETSSFMMQYMMHGRGATEVIDDLEELFQSRFIEFSEDLQSSD